MLAIVNGGIVVLAIGILIFVHELGHFLVAKKVGIRVEAFSLGFGPKIWGFTRGDTVYKLCLIPLGGYVKMSGEAPEDRPHEVRGDEFFSKTVAQRAWVVSAGVIMNVLFAVIAFPLAFAIGVPMETPVVGVVSAESPAWEAGIETDDEILSIAGTEMLGFSDIRSAVAFSDEPLEIVLRRNGEVLKREVSPAYSDAAGIHIIGVGPEISAPRLRKADDAPIINKVISGSLNERDEIVEIDGVPVDAAIAIEMIRFAETDELDLLVRKHESQKLEKVRVPLRLGDAIDDDRERLGISPIARIIEKVGTGKNQSDLARRLGLAVDDRLVAINDREIKQQVDISTALHRLAGQPSPLQVTVERAGERVVLGPVDFDGRVGSFYGSMSIGWDSTHVRVEYGSPAYAAGMRSGDRITRYGSKSFDGSEDHDWQALFEAIRDAKTEARDVVVERAGESIIFRGLEADLVRPSLLYLSLETLPQVHEVHRPFPASVTDGFAQTKYKITDIFMTLRGLFTGGVAAENLGGIIMIARVSYTFAEQGLGKILFFMAILSLNLAILNILPIPVLDGGHLVFLILEKIKGGPIDDRWMGYANVVGLVFILGLMLFVTYNDIMRLVTG